MLTIRILAASGLAAAVAQAEGAGTIAPEPTEQAELGSVFDERGVLTPNGTLILEPSLQYVHSSATQVAIEGYTVLPAVLVGLINVSEIQRDTLTAAVAARYGLTSRLELEARVPYVYKEESLRRRETNTGEAADTIRDSDGSGLGDVELALHYQLNSGRGGAPYYVANLRLKSRTGTSPFEVERRRLTNAAGQPTREEVLLEQPTGSGFWAVQPSLTVIYPSEPAVLYGNFSYLWNQERDLGEEFGEIDPGDVVGVSFGLGFAVNEYTSFSLGYDHSVVLETERENDTGLEPTFDRFHVGTFLLGMSHRLGPATSINLGLGIGVTEQAPDLQFTVKFPIRF